MHTEKKIMENLTKIMTIILNIRYLAYIPVIDDIIGQGGHSRKLGRWRWVIIRGKKKYQNMYNRNL